jgi:RimJ/RimL family protein N-acetyltransferase
MPPPPIALPQLRTVPFDPSRRAVDGTFRGSRHCRSLGDDQTTVIDRPLGAGEWDLVRSFVRRTAREDLRLRFGRPLNFDDEATLRRAFDLRAESGEVIWVLDDDAAIAAIAHRITLSRSEAEIALIVRSDVQRRGIGEFLLRQALARSARAGLKTLTGLVVWENRAMRRLAAKVGFVPGQGSAWALELTLDIARARAAV